MNKSYILVIFSILILSAFTYAVLANVEDEIATQGELEDIDEDIDADDVVSLNAEVQNITNRTIPKAKLNSIRVTSLSGFALSGTNGKKVEALWVTHTLSRENTNTTKGTGHFKLGVGDDKDQFKLLLKEITDNSIKFDVFQRNANLEKEQKTNSTTTEAIGALTISFTKYSEIVIWKGSLVLNSGDSQGTWEITGWSRTKEMHKEKLEQAKERQLNKRVEEARKNIDKAEERLNKTIERGEQQVQKAEQQLERAKRWWEFWKRG